MLFEAGEWLPPCTVGSRRGLLACVFALTKSFVPPFPHRALAPGCVSSSCLWHFQTTMLRTLALALVAAAGTEAFMAPASLSGLASSNRVAVKSGLNALEMKVFGELCKAPQASGSDSMLRGMLRARTGFRASSDWRWRADWKKRAALAADPAVGQLSEGKYGLLGNLAPAPGSKRPKTRKGRGISAGQGATCGFGMRGQKSRSGRPTRAGFEGGQMPLYRRLPKIVGKGVGRDG